MEHSFTTRHTGRPNTGISHAITKFPLIISFFFIFSLIYMYEEESENKLLFLYISDKSQPHKLHS